MDDVRARKPSIKITIMAGPPLPLKSLIPLSRIFLVTGTSFIDFSCLPVLGSSKRNLH